MKRAIIKLLCLGFSTFSYSQFVEESLVAGIDHYCLDPNQLSAGVAFFDFNNDGFQDLVLTGTYNDSKVYENQGNGKFIDVSHSIGLLEAGNFRASAVITGDFDNNGFTDLFFSSFTESRNYLFWNQDGNNFVEGATQAGVGQSFYGTSCAVADYNLDGNLDLFVGNYTGQDYMYVNNGNKTFTLRDDLFRTPSGVGSALAVAFSDIDADGDMDLLLGNEYERPPQLANRLYINNYPDDSFTEMSEAMNWDLKINTMGIASGDYDQDGDLDYYVSDISDNYFFEKKTGLALEEKAYNLGIANEESTSWGSSFFDYDNDTYLDLFVANGNIGTSASGLDNDKLFKGTATKNFQDVSASQHIDSDFLGRGVSIGDYDNDGKLDVVVGVMWYDSAVLKNTHTLLYRNNNTIINNWIKINLQGTASNADGYGSRIEARIGNRTLIREQTGGGSYMSHNSKVIHFGLGAFNAVDELTIKWPGNFGQDNFENLKAGKTYTIVEGGDLYENEYNKVVLLNGESIFLQREIRTIPGIYHDTIIPTSSDANKKIITTRLSFTNITDDAGTNGNDEDTGEIEEHYSTEDCNGQFTNSYDCAKDEMTENLEYKLFPIPVHDVMKLRSDYRGSLTLKIYDIYGKLILKDNIHIQTNEHSFSLENLPSGVYMALFVDQNGVKKISKKIQKY